jgi:hypothetical protein
MAEYLKEGHFVWIDEPFNSYYKIIRREPFDFVTGEEDSTIFAAVSSGSDSGYKNIELLEPDSDPLHLYQVRWGVEHTGDIKYYMKIPTGVNRFGVDEDKEVGFINADKSPHYDPNPDFEFYLISEWYPSINCSNDSSFTITPKVYFRGMKYDIQPVTDRTVIQKIETGQQAHRRIILGGIKPTR